MGKTSGGRYWRSERGRLTNKGVVCQRRAFFAGGSSLVFSAASSASRFFFLSFLSDFSGLMGSSTYRREEMHAQQQVGERCGHDSSISGQGFTQSSQARVSSVHASHLLLFLLLLLFVFLVFLILLLFLCRLLLLLFLQLLFRLRTSSAALGASHAQAFVKAIHLSNLVCLLLLVFLDLLLNLPSEGDGAQAVMLESK